MEKFWKFGKQDSKRLMEIIDHENGIIIDAIATSKKMGFHKKQVITGRTFFRNQVVGFIAQEDQEVDKKLWCNVKGFANGWRPRRLKKTRHLTEMFDGWTYGVSDAVCRELGLDNFVQCKVYTIAVEVVKDHVFINFYSEMGTPSCGREISNLTYNKWVGNPNEESGQ